MRLITCTLLFLVGTCAAQEEDTEAKPPASTPEGYDDPWEFEKDGDVYVLHDNDFDLFVKEHPTFLAEFYAPWCGHCKALAPVYEKVASKASIPLVRIDATVETELAKKYGVQGYPTLKLWKEGEEPSDYEGGRTEEDLIAFINQRTDPNYKPPPEEVVTLTKENFDDFIGSHALSLVEFYAPWCGHCKKLAPEYEKAAQMLKAQGSPIKLAKVDATVEKDLAEKYGVTGFPTLKIMRHGKRYEYDGPREAYGIIKFMQEQALPAAKKLGSVGAVQRFMQKEDVTIIGFFESDASPAFEPFSEAAEMLRQDFKYIGWVSDPEAFKKYDAKPNDMIIFYPTLFQSKFEPKSRTYNREGAPAEELVSFLRQFCLPLVGKRTKENIPTRYGKFPLVVVYYNADFSLQYREGSEYWRQKVLNIAQKYQKDNYYFAVADEEEFAEELQDVGLGDSGLEHNVLVFGHDGKKYPMDPEEFDGELEENLEAFMKKLNAGKIKPYYKSAPIPRDDKGPVRIVVGANFEKIVNDESKDVLIEFYAPWCGHCKAFEPKYKELAAKLKKTEPNLVIAKMDAIANDAPSPYSVEGFPTIYFAPSSKKKEPIKYTGNRDLDHLTNFMKEHAVRSFKGEKKETKKEDKKKEEKKEKKETKKEEKKEEEKKDKKETKKEEL